MNPFLIQPERKYRAEAEKQIADAGCRTRKDSVRVVETLVTASPEFFKGKKRAEIRMFFEAAGTGYVSCRSHLHFRPARDQDTS